MYARKKSMSEYGKELSDEEKSKIEAAIKEAEEAIRDGSLDTIKAKTEALATAAQLRERFDPRHYRLDVRVAPMLHLH